MKIDPDIQIAVAEEVCRKPREIGWSIREMERLQTLRESGEILKFKEIWKQ